MAWDWTTSRAHLRYLQTFSRHHPGSPDDRDYWPQVLGEPVVTTVDRLRSSGAITWATTPGDMRDRTVAELKDAADRLSPPRVGYALTEYGAELVARFRSAIATEEAAAIASVSQALAVGDFRAAYRIAAVQQVADPLRAHRIGRGVAPPTDADGARFERTMGFLASARPRLLWFLSDDEVRWVKWAAAHDLLWGETKVAVPDELNCGHLEDADALVRMMVFATYHLERTALAPDLPRRERGTIWQVRAVGDHQGCDACNRRHLTRGTLDELGELPHPGCTSPIGCRCLVRPGLTE